MARRRKTVRRSGGTVVIRERVAPVRRRRASAIMVASPRRVSRRRGGGGHRGGGKELVASVIAGAAIGFIEKQNLGLPSIPFLGKKGTIALLAFVWRKNGGPEWARDVAMVGAGLSGYQFAKDGRIDGDDE